MNKIDLTSRVFGRLTVIKENGRTKSGKPKWDCICVCGKEVNRVGANLLNGNTGSCGCLQKEMASNAKFVHGISNRTTEYRTWTNMKTRCYNKKVNDLDYIGKGIQVCDRWRYSFKNFFADMGLKPSPLHSIERLSSNGNYEPSNCKWGTEEEQVRNKGNNVWIEYNGLKMILQDWANYFGADQGNLGISIKAKGFNKVYEYYFKKHNGVFPNGKERVYPKTPNYNKPIPVVVYENGVKILETKSVRSMSRQIKIHHFIIETSIKNNTPYRGLTFKLTPNATTS